MTMRASWTDWHGAGLDLCDVVIGDEGLTLDGVLIGTRGGQYGASYRVRTDAAFRTREVRLRYIGGPALHVIVDEFGRWRDVLRDTPIPDLDGCHDVDIGATPATNALPIRRLGLAMGASRDIAVGYVPLPSEITATFVPRRADQRYTCLRPPHRYLYEGLFRGFSAELEVDGAGLVHDYPGTFRRVER